MRHRTLLFCLIVILALTSACSRGWPPQEELLIEHFASNKHGIEVLETMIAETDYWEVSSGPWKHGSDEAPDRAAVIVDTEAGRNRDWITGEHAIEWNEAFRDAGVWSIARDDRGTTANVMSDFPKDLIGFTFYRRPAEKDTSWTECRNEFRTVRCGECGIALDDGWWLIYRWVPKMLDQELWDAASEGEISWEEYEERDDELFEACLVEGAQIIGSPELTADSDD